MKHFLTLSLAFLLLSACGGNTLTVDLEFKTEDSSMISLLTTASEKVIERRAFGIENEIPDISVQDKGDKTSILVSLQNPESKDILAQQLLEPLNFFLMREAEEGEVPDRENELYGAYIKTGLSGEHLAGVSAKEIDDNASVTVTFTEEGKILWRTIYEENTGKKIGLFVRGGLVSSLTVPDEEFQDTITIAGVPSIELAIVFADDVNVATFVTFIPRL